LLNWLADKSGGALRVGVNLFRASLPPTASTTDLVAVLVPTAGQARDKSLRVDFPRFQLMHRAKNFAVAWADAQRVYAQLTAEETFPLRVGAKGKYVGLNSIRALQAPFSIGQDGNQSPLVVCNYELEIAAEPA
jgi:hypothetical protein